MIFNRSKIAFPDYQNKTGNLFRRAKQHDLNQWNAAKNHIQNFRVCLDIGAHVGTSAMRFSKHFENVYSFEPIPDLFECLEYNTQDLDNVHTNNIAIGEKHEQVKIYVNTRNSAASVIESKNTADIIASRWGNRKRKDFQKMPSIEVECKTIDSFNFENVDFIKIDTEGYNIEPLKGMINTIKKWSPVIQLERGNGKHAINVANEFLFKHGYRIVESVVIDDIFVRI